MILFSTILNINDSLTKDAFVNLVLEWNRTSKYIENLDLNSSYSGKFGNEKLFLEFVDYTGKNLMGFATRGVCQWKKYVNIYVQLRFASKKFEQD